MRIKTLTFFSQSHLRLYKTFMNSYPVHTNVDLVIRYIPQNGDGDYRENDSHFTQQMKNKVILILDYLKNLQDDELLFFLDINLSKKLFISISLLSLVLEISDLTIIFFLSLSTSNQVN